MRPLPTCSSPLPPPLLPTCVHLKSLSAPAAADLQDIGDLEGYVRATGVMLFFLSKHYFTSRNCIREVKASIDEQRPLVLVHEQQEEKGGPLEMMRRSAARRCARTSSMGARQSRGTASRTTSTSRSSSSRPRCYGTAPSTPRHRSSHT